MPFFSDPMRLYVLPDATFCVGFCDLLCVIRGLFEVEKAVCGYLFLAVLRFWRNGFVTICVVYRTKRWIIICLDNGTFFVVVSECRRRVYFLLH